MRRSTLGIVLVFIVAALVVAVAGLLSEGWQALGLVALAAALGACAAIIPKE